MMTFGEVAEIILRIKFMDRTFTIQQTRSAAGVEWYLQLRYMDADVDTNKIEEQHGRKWLLSPHMTTSEIVQTALKAVLTSQEHIARERFTYRGERVYGPHFDVEDLVELCKTGKLDVRPPKP